MMAIYWDPIKQVWMLTKPVVRPSEVVAVAAPPSDLGVSLKSIYDVMFTISPRDLASAIMNGGNYITYTPCERKRHKRRGPVRVQEVAHKDYVIFVVWGTSRDVADLFGIKFKISKSLADEYCPFVLGWKFVYDNDFELYDPISNPILRM